MFQYHQSYQYTSYCNYLPYTSQRRTGRVKFFNVNKGYGFIIPSENSNGSRFIANQTEEEVFVHHTSILNSNKGFIVGLDKGEKVEYELHHGPKGIYALHVTGPKGRPVHYTPYQGLLHYQQQQAKSELTYQQYHPQQPYVTYVIPHPLSLQYY